MAKKEALTRNLTVIFGFFFVLLSTFVTVISNVTEIDDTAKIVFYGIAVFISLGGIMIGLEILDHYSESGIGYAGKWGFVILIVVVPAFYIVGIALLLKLDTWWIVGAIAVLVLILEGPRIKSSLTKSPS